MTEPYTCRDAFRRIGDYLDRELTPQEMAAVRRHLEACVVCAREFAFEAGLLAGLKQRLRRLDLPEDVRSRLASALAAARPPPPASD